MALLQDRFHGNQAELARAIKRSPGQVHQWVKGHRKIGDAGARHIEMALGLPQGWLDGDIRQRLDNVAEPPGRYDIGQVPLISWVAAGAWDLAHDQFQPGDAAEWLPCPAKHGPSTFALRVRGDSMTAPHPGQRSYPDGTIIYVDPDAQVTNGARVVARLTGTDEVTFKVFAQDAGRVYLKSINPTYPPLQIDGDAVIVGVVVGSFMPE